ncbi:DotI/IcmL family type IV secretion protein [Escherichia coli]|uniref:DotI/IcmL family type IV secretion protein n=1 Tax=Escherichia coli TaxID=562 RepID=UPI0007A03710|nr:DotI/IcmL family type IV secretion protein [Escherichia coli]EJE7371180.1 DotI/IcmL family type IV secretion protein [Shigella dysenteriae]EEC8173551.1 conjugal transfer protein TraM [Escherichia coli]EEQ1581293.1 conjugal transfer protein TraM [Escherichia coli]EEQ1611858.1 conjugal transfer protein TraM [Escherichia coli]EEQ6994163.1 conjugal transfer protein TraM [Escherichia coli]
MSETHPTSPVSPETDNSGDIYKQTLSTIAQSEQRAALVPGLVRALLCSSAALVISLTGNIIQYWHNSNVTREYFATDNGRLVRLAPTSQPAWSQSDVMTFGSMTLSEAFNLDFVHYRKQITTLAPRFSEAGFAGYVNALQASNILDTIKKEKFNLTATIGAGTLVNQGQMENGIWFWKFQYPVRMRLVGQTSTRPEQAFTFEITVRRVDPRIKPGGMEISQMVSRNAASGT